MYAKNLLGWLARLEKTKRLLYLLFLVTVVPIEQGLLPLYASEKLPMHLAHLQTLFQLQCEANWKKCQHTPQTSTQQPSKTILVFLWMFSLSCTLKVRNSFVCDPLSLIVIGFPVVLYLYFQLTVHLEQGRINSLEISRMYAHQSFPRSDILVDRSLATACFAPCTCDIFTFSIQLPGLLKLFFSPFNKTWRLT